MTETTKEPLGMAAQSATTHSKNTAKHCAFEGRVLTAVLKLTERGYSEA